MFACAHRQFCTRSTPPLTTVGADSIAPLLSIRERGRTVVRTGKYCLEVSGEAVWLDFQTNRPSAMDSVTSKVATLTRKAPRIPLKTINIAESVTVANRYPGDLRYFASFFILMAIASFLFKNTPRVADLHYYALKLYFWHVRPAKYQQIAIYAGCNGQRFRIPIEMVGYNCRCSESTSLLGMSLYVIPVFESQQRLVGGRT